jgi:SAM-dependent methyltransferase
MTNPESDRAFTGAVPIIYDTYLVPLLFEPYASDLARRVAARAPRRVLEIAAGTGAVTRALSAALPQSATIVATDLNQTMLDQAAARGTTHPVEWRQADAMSLPFADSTFDLVVCQFGVMFLPDKPAAFLEARRVLRPGGTFMFSVWDRIGENEFAQCVTAAMASMFPADPPAFMARTPHGYFATSVIEGDLAAAGFHSPEIATVAFRSRAESPAIPALAFCQGTPLRNEIEARNGRLSDATDAAKNAIAARFGAEHVDGKIQARVVTVQKP